MAVISYKYDDKT